MRSGLVFLSEKKKKKSFFLKNSVLVFPPPPPPLSGVNKQKWGDDFFWGNIFTDTLIGKYGSYASPLKNLLL